MIGDAFVVLCAVAIALVFRKRKPLRKVEKTMTESYRPIHFHNYEKEGLSQRVLEDVFTGRNPSVVLNRSKDNLHKVIVNMYGRFENFPGVEKWYSIIENRNIVENGAIHFRTEFIDHGDGYRCLWKVQEWEDGRDYMDEDGYGMEPDTDEVILYADLNRDGEFTGPFRLYSVNGRVLESVK